MDKTKIMDIIKKINKSKNIFQILPQLTTKQIEEILIVAADAYYNSDVSLITDHDYDILRERLERLNPKSKVLEKTGATVKTKNKVELPFWMGSMNKIKENKELQKWLKEYGPPYVVSDKLDGISCLLVLEDGEITLYTRGDGSYGQNVSHLARYVNMSADKFVEQNKRNRIAVRGELIMKKDKFEKYASILSNARNTVAGIVNSKPESLNKKLAMDVDFVTYEIIEPLLKPSDQMKTLKKWGLNSVHWDIYQDVNMEILDSILQKRKKKSVYEIDGVIVTDDEKHKRNLSGNPSYSFAYKGISQTADVKVIEVIWRPSKDGMIIPRIHFEKVRLSQADLEYTTGFHAKYIVTNKIGPGAIITVIRSGDVIPYIMGVVKPAKKPSLPEDLDYHWDKNHVNIILDDMETNEDVIIRRLTKFMSDIGVDGLSEGIVTRLVKAGYDNIPKILSMTVDDFLELDGFQETLADKLYGNLKNALDNLGLLTLMVASNTFGRGFGERKIKKILDEYPNIVSDYDDNDRTKWEKKLKELEGFDTISVNAFLDPLPDFQKLYKNIKKIIKIKPYVKIVKKKGRFSGENIVFTGFRNKDWEKIIENEGGKVSGSVSRNSTILVYNDGEETSGKYKKAKQLGIKTMSKSEFEKQFDL